MLPRQPLHRFVEAVIRVQMRKVLSQQRLHWPRIRDQLLQQMQTYIDDQAYYITFSVSDQLYFHTSNVKGVDVSGAEPILNLYTIEPAS